MTTANLIQAKTDDFSLDLFRQISNSTSTPANVVFSPASIILAIALIHRAAAGSTRRQISDRLFGSNVPDANIVENLSNLNKFFSQQQKNAPNVTLNSANRIFVDNAFALLPSYFTETREIFQTEQAEKLNFAAQIQQAKQKINQWVADKTNQKILNFLKELDPTTRVIVANAIHFKANWKFMFNESLTKNGDFNVDQNKIVKVAYMDINNIWPMLGSDGDSKILLLPFADVQGANLSMLFLLPQQNFGLKSVEQSMTSQKLWSLIDSARNDTRATKVTVPKFTLEKSIELKQVLQTMGLTEMFSERADLSKLTGTRNLFVGDAVHKTFFEINEKGAEAAAATAMKLRSKSLPPHFFCNEPFFFAIVDTKTRTLLFLGHFYGQ